MKKSTKKKTKKSVTLYARISKENMAFLVARKKDRKLRSIAAATNQIIDKLRNHKSA